MAVASTLRREVGVRGRNHCERRTCNRALMTLIAPSKWQHVHNKCVSQHFFRGRRAVDNDSPTWQITTKIKHRPHLVHYLENATMRHFEGELCREAFARRHESTETSDHGMRTVQPRKNTLTAVCLSVQTIRWERPCVKAGEILETPAIEGIAGHK